MNLRHHFFVWSLFPLVSYAQRDSTMFQNKLLPQEKVYVHMDNNAYAQGDTIWYNAYVVRADNNHASPLSRILYVELLDEQGYLRERQQLVVDRQGQAHGQFAIRSDAFPGHYELRAYTKWMLNFYDGLFMAVQRLSDPVWTTFVPPAKPGKRGEVIASERKPFSINYVEIVRCVDAACKYVTETRPVRGMGLSESDSMDYVHDTRKIFRDESVALPCYKLQNGLYSRVFPVYKRPASDSLFRAKVMPMKLTMGDVERIYLDDDISVRFFPEGGHLVDSMECRIGWEIYDREGRRLNMSGVLLDGGKKAADLKPLYAGRGSFLLFPSVRGNYKAVFDVSGKHYTFSLPKVEHEGCMLQVYKKDSLINILVGRRFEQERTLRMAVTSRGQLVSNLPLKFVNDRTSVSFLSDELPLGVNRVTIYDEDENILADRLFFVRNAEGAASKVHLSVTGYDRTKTLLPYSRQRLDFHVQDGNGRPVAGQQFSLSVRDASLLDKDYSRGNVLTYLLLQSEVKGFIENPEYYFQEGTKYAEALDQLLMIQGWRRYDWKQMAHPEKFRPQYTPEQCAEVMGHVYNLRRLRACKGPIGLFCSLYLKSGRTQSPYLYQGHIKTDSLGFFKFQITPFYGEAQLNIRAYNLADKNRKANVHDPHFFVRKDWFYPLCLKPLSWYELHMPVVKEPVPGQVEEDHSVDYPAYVLPHVVVKNKHRTHVERKKDFPVAEWSFFDLQNDLWDIGWYDAVNLFDGMEQSYEYFQERMREYIVHQSPTDWFEEQMCPIFNWKDGKYRTGKETYQYVRFLNTVDSIRIITDASRRPSNSYLHQLDRHQLIQNSNGATLYEEKGLLLPQNLQQAFSVSWGYSSFLNQIVQDPHQQFPLSGRQWNLKGFNRSVEFYSPAYATGNGNPQDHRRTLYWNPAVTTDAEGNASIEFYNSSTCTDLDIVVDGVTTDGHFIMY